MRTVRTVQAVWILRAVRNVRIVRIVRIVRVVRAMRHCGGMVRRSGGGGGGGGCWVMAVNHAPRQQPPSRPHRRTRTPRRHHGGRASSGRRWPAGGRGLRRRLSRCWLGRRRQLEGPEFDLPVAPQVSTTQGGKENCYGLIAVRIDEKDEVLVVVLVVKVIELEPVNSDGIDIGGRDGGATPPVDEHAASAAQPSPEGWQVRRNRPLGRCLDNRHLPRPRRFRFGIGRRRNRLDRMRRARQVVGLDGAELAERLGGDGGARSLRQRLHRQIDHVEVWHGAKLPQLVVSLQPLLLLLGTHGRQLAKIGIWRLAILSKRYPKCGRRGGFRLPSLWLRNKKVKLRPTDAVRRGIPC